VVFKIKMSKLAFVFLFGGLSAVLAIPQGGQDVACLEVNRQSDNEEIRRQLQDLLVRFWGNSDRPQPEFGRPTLDPTVIRKASPIQVRIIKGGPKVPAQLSDITVRGYSTTQLEELEVSGSGDSRRVRFVARMPRVIIDEAQLTVRGKNPLEVTVSGVFRDATLYEEVQISSSGTRIINEEIVIEGNSDVEVRPKRLPISENAVIELVETALTESGRDDTITFFNGVVRERC